MIRHHREGCENNKPLATEVTMSMVGEMTLEDAAKQLGGNWKSWTCFVWDSSGAHHTDNTVRQGQTSDRNRDTMLRAKERLR